MRMRGSRVGKVLRFQVNKVSKRNYSCWGLGSHALFCCHTKVTAANEFDRQAKVEPLNLHLVDIIRILWRLLVSDRNSASAESIG